MIVRFFCCHWLVIGSGESVPDFNELSNKERIIHILNGINEVGESGITFTEDRNLDNFSFKSNGSLIRISL